MKKQILLDVVRKPLQKLLKTKEGMGAVGGGF